ncbi:hypothetical protein J2Z65_003226 [Paenibacillus aceris]|uniref:Uncharacterized protein n=1 Tax=Paenibacillus aceris TaxID=869555 RepID=A0ABS4HZN3_9BACL|nr:hypothetical protein [Paenibacillus aceris]
MDSLFWLSVWDGADIWLSSVGHVVVRLCLRAYTVLRLWGLCACVSTGVYGRAYHFPAKYWLSEQ